MIFFLQYQINPVLLFLWYITLCKTWKNTPEFHLHCWDHVCKVNELCLVEHFHRKFRISTQIMVHEYCIRKCKKCSVYYRLLITLQAIFLVIQNVYINSSPGLSISFGCANKFHKETFPLSISKNTSIRGTTLVLPLHKKTFPFSPPENTSKAVTTETVLCDLYTKEEKWSLGWKEY